MLKRFMNWLLHQLQTLWQVLTGKRSSSRSGGSSQRQHLSEADDSLPSQPYNRFSQRLDPRRSESQPEPDTAIRVEVDPTEVPVVSLPTESFQTEAVSADPMASSFSSIEAQGQRVPAATELGTTDLEKSEPEILDRFDAAAETVSGIAPVISRFPTDVSSLVDEASGEKQAANEVANPQLPEIHDLLPAVEPDQSDQLDQPDCEEARDQAEDDGPLDSSSDESLSDELLSAESLSAESPSTAADFLEHAELATAYEPLEQASGQSGHDLPSLLEGGLPVSEKTDAVPADERVSDLPESELAELAESEVSEPDSVELEVAEPDLSEPAVPELEVSEPDLAELSASHVSEVKLPASIDSDDQVILCSFDINETEDSIVDAVDRSDTVDIAGVADDVSDAVEETDAIDDMVLGGVPDVTTDHETVSQMTAASPEPAWSDDDVEDGGSGRDLDQSDDDETERPVAPVDSPISTVEPIEPIEPSQPARSPWPTPPSRRQSSSFTAMPVSPSETVEEAHRLLNAAKTVEKSEQLAAQAAETSSLQPVVKPVVSGDVLAEDTAPATAKTGVVKLLFTFKPGNLHGYIAPDDGSKDILFHQKYINAEVFERLERGTRVSVEVKYIEGKVYATRVDLL